MKEIEENDDYDWFDKLAMSSGVIDSNEIIIDDEIKSRLYPLRSDEYDILEQSILDEGCRDPLILWNNILVDGHNRYSICKKHSLPYKTIKKNFVDMDTALRWIDLNQYGRRNLTDLQMADLRGRYYNSIKKDGFKGNQYTKSGEGQNVHNQKTGEIIAEKFKVDDRTIRRDAVFSNSIDELKRSVGKEVVDTILAGDLKISKQDIVKIAELDPFEQEKIIDKIKDGESLKIIKNKIYKEKERELKDISSFDISDDDIELYNCDILDSDIEDESIDVIITDPPYPRDYLDCWRKLADFAVKKLKNGGVLVAMSGQSYLPDVYRNMNIEGLNYYWTGCIYTPGISPNLQTKRLLTHWKPLLIYVKGSYSRTFQKSDVYISNYNDTKEGQDFHKWGQSLPIIDKIVNDWTYKNDIVCDPFLGGGTTGVACKNNKRKFIGIEINEDTYEIAKKRIIENDYSI